MYRYKYFSTSVVVLILKVAAISVHRLGVPTSLLLGLAAHHLGQFPGALPPTSLLNTLNHWALLDGLMRTEEELEVER